MTLTESPRRGPAAPGPVSVFAEPAVARWWVGVDRARIVSDVVEND